MRGWEDLYGRPRPVPLADILREHDHLPTPRATIKAHTTPHRPPSPLRMLMGLLFGRPGGSPGDAHPIL